MNATRHQRMFWIVLLLSILWLTGCTVQLQHNLTEREANDMITLFKKNGIEATKLENKEGRVPTWTITVDKGEMQKALRIMRDNNLPRRKEQGFQELYGKAGMIPTASEERAKYLMALSGELSRTFKRVDGVLDARVHLVLPKKQVLKDPTKKAPRPRASVMLIVRANPRPLLRKKQVQAMVSGSIEKLQRSDISVIMIPQRGVAEATGGGDGEALTNVLMVRVARSDSMKLKMMLGLMILGLVIFLGLFVFFFMRAASLKNQLKASRNGSYS